MASNRHLGRVIVLQSLYEYELRIYKKLYVNSVISIKFLGLNPEFFMMVKLKFARDLSIYFNGVMLTNLNSLNKIAAKVQKKLHMCKKNRKFIVFTCVNRNFSLILQRFLED